MLHVWLRAQHSPLVVWHTDTKQWHEVDSWQQLHDIYGIHGHKALCLYFPSHHVLQVNSTLSAAQLKQLGITGKQYLFEESSLTSVEQLAIRQIGDTNNDYLYALADSDIQMWQQSAELSGLTIQALLPDFLLLPVPEEGLGQQAVLYQDTYTTLLRQSLYQGLAVSYLPLIFERLPQLSELCVLPSLDILTSALLSRDEVAIGGVNENINDNSRLQTVASELSASYPETLNQIAPEIITLITEHQLLLTVIPSVPTPIINPERHELNFFLKTSNSQLSPYLRVAMMVMLSALVLQIATDGVQWYRYNQAAATTQAAVAAQYQSWFPNETLSTHKKLQSQMQPKLRTDGQASATHIAILSRVAPLIKQSSLQAQTLIMEPSILSFTLIASNRSSLDEFTSLLIAQGLNANLESVNSNEHGQFSGQVTVSVVADDTASPIATES